MADADILCRYSKAAEKEDTPSLSDKRITLHYGIVILADLRYNRADKRSKLPPWIVQFIRESSLHLSTDLDILRSD
eukprot:gene32451-42040_t